jgi:putative transposase
LAFRPSASQEAALLCLLGICAEVYNAGLQERRDAWRRCRKSVRLFDQFNQIRHLRGQRDDALSWGIQPLRSTLRRLDEAYSSFYRRCARGETPGHPRFKSACRFNTVCWDEPASWAISVAAGTLRIQGVGTIRLPRGAIRQLDRFVSRGGVPVTLTVTRRRAGNGWSWRACVGFKAVAAVKTAPTAGADALVGADRGVAVTVALSDGALRSMPRFLADAREEISELLRQRGGKKLGSRAWRALNREILAAHRRAVCRSDNWARKTARELVSCYGVAVLEDLNLNNMTRSARGTKENPGTNVAAKQALNRSLADAALGRFRHWVCVKAEEAGRRTWVVNPANTSRTCAACGYCASGNRRSVDRFRCAACGHEAHADINAAENIAARGRACETAWREAGSFPLPRPRPRLRRSKTATEPARSAQTDKKPGAGPAPGHAPPTRVPNGQKTVHRPSQATRTMAVR